MCLLVRECMTNKVLQFFQQTSNWNLSLIQLSLFLAHQFVLHFFLSILCLTVTWVKLILIFLMACFLLLCVSLYLALSTLTQLSPWLSLSFRRNLVLALLLVLILSFLVKSTNPVGTSPVLLSLFLESCNWPQNFSPYPYKTWCSFRYFPTFLQSIFGLQELHDCEVSNWCVSVSWRKYRGTYCRLLLLWCFLTHQFFAGFVWNHILCLWFETTEP